jgi:hypothetical protein
MACHKPCAIITDMIGRFLQIRKHQTLLFFLIIGIAIIISIAFNYSQGIYNYYESEQYIPFYLGQASLLTKIFDYTHTDIGSLYRARELASLFNCLDAYIILWSAKIGFPQLLSGIYFICLLLIISIQYRLAKKFFDSILVIPLLMALVFLTTPTILFSGYYFRTSKIIVSLGLSVLSYLLIKFGKLADGNKVRLSIYSVLFWGLTVFVGLIDELGIAISVLLIEIVLYLSYKKRQYIWVVIGSVVGLMTVTLYRHFIGPVITSWIIGIKPDLWELTGMKFWDFPIFQQSAYEFGVFLRSFMGNLPEIFWFVPILIGTVLTAIMKSPDDSNRLMSYRKIPDAIGIGTFFTLNIFVIIFILGLRSGGFSPVLTLLYLPIPFMTILYILFHLLMLKTVSVHPRLRSPLSFGLFIWLVFNVVAIPGYQVLFADQKYNAWPNFHQAEKIISAISQSEIPLEKYNLQFPNTAGTIRKLNNPLPGTIK